MITAVDTNVLLDVMISGAPHSEEPERAPTQAVMSGAVIISEPVYTELASRFAQQQDLDRFLTHTHLQFEPLSQATLHAAGQAWGAYVRRRPTALECPQCGAQQSNRCAQCGASIQPRQHIVADFIIGAHALLQADRLLTRDRRYYRTYFPRLALG